MTGKLNDSFRRYGMRGLVEKVILYLLNAVGIRCEREYCFSISVLADSFSFLIPEQYFHDFKKLTLEDFQLYGDPNWYNPEKMAVMERCFEEKGNAAYGIIEQSRLVCSGWLSLVKFGDDAEGLFPFLKDSDCYLWDDYTHPAFRGKGLHRWLTAYRLYEASKSGKKKAFSFVAAFNRASVKGFLRCGFEKKQIFWNYKIGRGKAKTTFQYE